MSRDYTPADRLLSRLGQGLALLAPKTAQRSNPADRLPEAELQDEQRRHTAGLMRVNHAGEIAAQALYHGQAFVARDGKVRDHLLAAAHEEQDHLQWCEERLRELGSSPSRLQPLWYAGSFAIGAAAGLAGDRWSLGFVEETEKQVSEHLDEHLRELPEADQRSRAILKTMRDDEARHASEAQEAGARPLPYPVRELMRKVAGFMKKGAYRF
ncbi:2-polyprenyl-3-methyl-6-methoxy-1,4-benzoquinone monooxygenase [Solimonas sp. K1W22B-7]|uniref:2-polyprenyl-3-methyl-6-methoxy-1,4-benzoquinone monooxygenase n=1 Tax=Solimonas sp. K1W22B-7 TaxID=2303331 RepID=UPI000E3333FE|nr:2-polyprenyl-3-methyl-6-methoxy-1,4-benzoquinone monooxygenase [Solimonas sp. K1W22B-7]AXQ28258.1 2-polyprenyl-3-methyl-6-methoxy-1,4-benzoquinone monooxygenase [Solimonas sp. K1W22B-7]